MKRSAGVLMFRQRDGELQVLLVHPGGPLWASKDEGVWSIPKGEIDEGEEPLAAARRELEEETGFTADGPAVPLTPVRQPGGKLVLAWAVPGDADPATLRSNEFVMEWPPRSGRMQSFPEVDRAAWFSIADAKRKILRGQAPLLDELVRLLAAR
ncbi:MAG TPA: NUDIX domain-containing protein [Candidatus Limnocylindria bacterium]|nr:NUDIX domain-containing protein [Candidatus Limnocylindria bacterium]